MKRRTSSSTKILAKQAWEFEAMAVRAGVRRDRALRLGNAREAKGAEATIENSLATAKKLHENIAAATQSAL